MSDSLGDDISGVGQYIKCDSVERIIAEINLSLHERFIHLIPSIILGKDGLTINKLHLISENFICNTDIPTNEGNLTFDIIPKRSIEFARFILMNESGNNIKLFKNGICQIGTLALAHSFKNYPFTNINYAGINRAEWIAKTNIAFQITEILRK